MVVSSPCRAPLSLGIAEELERGLLGVLHPRSQKGPACGGWVDVLSAMNFLSSACFAAKQGIVATFFGIVFLYTVVMTATITRCRPSAKKSSATTSPGLERSAARRPLASVTTAASGTPASRRMVLMTPTSLACTKWRIPPLGHRTTWRSRDSSSPACTPHCVQCRINVGRCHRPSDWAPVMRRIVVRAISADA